MTLKSKFLFKFKISPQKIGGSNIKKLMAETGVQITSDPNDAGTWTIFAPNR